METIYFQNFSNINYYYENEVKNQLLLNVNSLINKSCEIIINDNIIKEFQSLEEKLKKQYKLIITEKVEEYFLEFEKKKNVLEIKNSLKNFFKQKLETYEKEIEDKYSNEYFLLYLKYKDQKEVIQKKRKNNNKFFIKS